MSSLNVRDLEEGCFWRVLEPPEIEIFNSAKAGDPSSYGITKFTLDNHDGMKELLGCSRVRDQACVRMQVSKAQVSMWASRGGAYLRVPVAALTENEWETVQNLPDIYVVGAAAVRHGMLTPVDLEEEEEINAEDDEDREA